MREVSSIGHFTIDLPSADAATALCGPGNSFLKKFESLTGVTLTIRGLQLEMNGIVSNLEKASALLELTRPIWEQGLEVPEVDLRAAYSSLNLGQGSTHAELSKKVLARSKQGKFLRPRTIRQKAYVETIENYDLTFAIGPAGTGKTFLATVLAARLLTEKRIEKIVLTRPAVEAGENLGFLPGDLQQKVDPYLRPLFDSLHNIFGIEKTNSLIDKGVIEVAPLAFMRGRTLDNSLVILDEAQNTTNSQMRMFLTRLGERSKMVINGDITQIDLKGQESGLVEAIRIFSKVDGIKICYLTIEDIVRHPLVQKIIEAYQ
ncbi:MAG: phosphate starvation-inducible protein PhoH [Prochlorococcus sp. SP3034]|nr:phosphate starvation-inducible protein PhoH [Prochlorococcus sp. SP3034]|tara:strand:+ start:4127 stop:5080 length:954 start_codon:yes stop_codon:yes gene_type:complete